MTKVAYRRRLTEWQTAATVADGLAKNGSDAETGCRNELQKWVAETVQILAQIGGAEKNGTDAETYADLMQMNLQKKCRKRDKTCTNLVQNQTPINTDTTDLRVFPILQKERK